MAPYAVLVGWGVKIIFFVLTARNSCEINEMEDKEITLFYLY
jgi:hypothetical protein